MAHLSPLLRLLYPFALLTLFSSCNPLKKEEAQAIAEPPPPAIPNFLYVVSGATYAGNGVTPLAASNTIVRYALNGAFDKVIFDYNISPGDQPVKIVNYDSSHLLVLVENASGGRRVDKVSKVDGTSVTFISNAAISGGIVRDLLPTFDGGWLISRSTLVEKFNSARNRTPIGSVTPWVSAPGGACATSTTLIPSILEGPGNQIVFAHAAAAQNRIGIVKKTGYSAASDCVSALSAPTVNHFPTAMMIHSSGKLFVAYANNTVPTHAIYAYDISNTAITNPVQAYNDPSIVMGVTAMTEMQDGRVLVSSAHPSMNTIELFNYDGTTNALSRVGTSFILPSTYTKSISSMLITN